MASANTVSKPTGGGSTLRENLRLLAERDFLRVWLVGALFGVMRWLEVVVIGVYVFDLTASPLLVSLMIVMRTLPLLLFGPVAGALGERFDRRTLVAGGMAMMVATSVTLAALAFLGVLAIWHLALGAFLGGILWSTDMPIRRALLGDIAGTERFGAAMALDTATNHATRMLGPSLGGLLLDGIGLHGAFVLGIGVYAAAAVLAMRVPRAAATVSPPGWTMVANLAEGFRFMAGHRLLLATLVVTMIFNFWGFAFTALVPAIGRDDLRLSAFAIGILLSTEAFGALAASIVIAATGTAGMHVRVYFVGTLVFLVAVLGFSLSPWFALSLPILFVAGAGTSAFAVMQATIPFLVAPPGMRSRALGVVTLGIGIGPFGMLHVGLLADFIGAAPAVTVIAVEGLVALAAAALVWPELRRRGVD